MASFSSGNGGYQLDSCGVFLWLFLRIYSRRLWVKEGSAYFSGYHCLSVPSWLTTVISAPDLAALLLRLGQTFLFFALLGIWAFDYKIFRQTLQEKFTWTKLFQFERLPNLTALSSVLYQASA